MNCDMHWGNHVDRGSKNVDSEELFGQLEEDVSGFEMLCKTIGETHEHIKCLELSHCELNPAAAMCRLPFNGVRIQQLVLKDTPLGRKLVSIEASANPIDTVENLNETDTVIVVDGRFGAVMQTFSQDGTRYYRVRWLDNDRFFTL